MVCTLHVVLSGGWRNTAWAGESAFPSTRWRDGVLTVSEQEVSPELHPCSFFWATLVRDNPEHSEFIPLARVFPPLPKLSVAFSGCLPGMSREQQGSLEQMDNY